MEIIQQITANRQRHISVGRLEINEPFSITAIFATEELISGENIPTTLPVMDGLVVNITPGIKQLWEQLETKILEQKQAQIDNPKAVALAPNYQGFSDSLLASEIFQECQIAAARSNEANLHYTNFAWQLGQAINGLPNVAALQVCLNNMLAVLPPEIEAAELVEMLSAHRIPLHL